MFWMRNKENGFPIRTLSLIDKEILFKDALLSGSMCLFSDIVCARMFTEQSTEERSSIHEHLSS